MESTNLTLRGESADRFADAFVEEKAETARRSLNKRGVRNIHRYDGDGVTQVAYEQAAPHLNSWLLLSLLIETVDSETVTVVVFVGGSGEGPFKWEDSMLKSVIKGTDTVGEAGRLASVLRDVRDVADSLDLTVQKEWDSDGDGEPVARLLSEIFEP